MTSLQDNDIVFVAAKRTAFGTFSGTLKKLTATDLAVHAAQAALTQSGLVHENIQHVIFGNVQQTSADAIYLARHVGLRCSLPQAVPALTVNRLCGSGFESVIVGAKELMLGEAQAVLVGGTESMSQAPHVVRGMREGSPFGRPPAMEDSLWTCLTDSYTGDPMGITAENLAEKYEISREACDAYAVQSQQRWVDAQQRGAFKNEIVGIDIKQRKNTIHFDTDEHPRLSDLAALARLKPVFKKDGVVTAGNASGICDGASALIMCTAEFARTHQLKALARLASWGVSGCDPKIMGIGPVPAAKIALQRAQMQLADMGLVEVNEAFAAQYLAVEKELGIDREKCNVDGGAISLGHPLGASGARITTHLIYAMQEKQVEWSLGSACIGGGQGIALVLQALN